MGDAEDPQPGPSGENSANDGRNPALGADVSTLSDLTSATYKRAQRRPRVVAKKGFAKSAGRPSKADVSMNKTLKAPPKRTKVAAIMEYQTLNEALARELNEERMKSQELAKLTQQQTDQYSSLLIEHRRLKHLFEKFKANDSDAVAGSIRQAKRKFLESMSHEIEVLQGAFRAQAHEIRKLRDGVVCVERSHEDHAKELSGLLRRLREARYECDVADDGGDVGTSTGRRNSSTADFGDVAISTNFSRSGDGLFAGRSPSSGLMRQSLHADASSSSSISPGSPPGSMNVNFRRRRAANSLMPLQPDQRQQHQVKQRGVALPHISGTAIRKVNIKVDRLSVQCGVAGPSSVPLPRARSESEGERSSPEVVEIDCEDAPQQSAASPRRERTPPPRNNRSPANASSPSRRASSSSMELTTLSQSGAIQVDNIEEPLVSDDEAVDDANQAAVDLTGDDDEEDGASTLRNAPERDEDPDVIMMDAEDSPETRAGDGEERDSSSEGVPEPATSDEERREVAKSRNRRRTGVASANSAAAVEGNRNETTWAARDGGGVADKRRKLAPDEAERSQPPPRISRPTSVGHARARSKRRLTLFDDNGDPVPSTSAMAAAVAAQANVDHVDEEPDLAESEETDRNIPEPLPEVDGEELVSETSARQPSPRISLERLDEPKAALDPPHPEASVDEGDAKPTEGRTRRNASKQANYKEPSLNSKLRRGDPMADPLSLELAPSLARKSARTVAGAKGARKTTRLVRSKKSH